MAFGLTPAGFLPKTRDDIAIELEASLRAAFGASIDLTATANFGQFVGIMADRLGELWDLGQAVYESVDPDKASGARLVAIAALTGTTPRKAASSAVLATLTGTAGTAILAGRTISVTIIGTQFATIEDGALVAVPAWVLSTVYAVGAFASNGGNTYRVTVAGTSASSGGPAGTTRGVDITDGSVTWRFVGLGAAMAQVATLSVQNGPRIAVTDSLTVIETGVSGWLSVTNLADAILGRDADSDSQLRTRREDELLGESESVIDAIRVGILEGVPNVTNVIVFQNDTEATNGDGMPPHSVECMVQGGLDQDITEAVYRKVGAGITPFGNQTGTVVDTANGNQTYSVEWSRPTPKLVYVIVNLVKIPNDPTSDIVDQYPADGDAQVLNAILAYGAAVLPGRDVVSSRIKATAFKVPGVLDVTTAFIGLSPSPASQTTVAIALRELAVYDSSRIIIVSTDGTP